VRDETWTLHGGNCPGYADAISQARRPGAVLSVEATPRSLFLLEKQHTSRERTGALLARAWLSVAHVLPDDAVGRRTMWSRFEFVVEGPRAWLEVLGHKVLAALRSDEELAGIDWRVLITELLPGDPTRSFFADPDGELEITEGSVLAWVQPFSGDGWRESWARPLVTLLEH